jgi:formyltetrahydrofolate hydrolase
MQSFDAEENVAAARSIMTALGKLHSFKLPWKKESAEHNEAIMLRSQRNYHCLLDELEHRAISRHFEIEKLGLPKTGELSS